MSGNSAKQMDLGGRGPIGYLKGDVKYEQHQTSQCLPGKHHIRTCSSLVSSSTLMCPDVSLWPKRRLPQIIWTSSSVITNSTIPSYPSTLQKLRLPAPSSSNIKLLPPNTQPSSRGPGSSMSLVILSSFYLSHSVPQFCPRRALLQFSAIWSLAPTYSLRDSSFPFGLSTPTTRPSPVLPYLL